MASASELEQSQLQLPLQPQPPSQQPVDRKVTPVPVPLPVPTPVPSPPVLVSSLPQKRSLEDDHAPPVSSPLNPNPDLGAAAATAAAMSREKPARTKKESLKKRESKGGSTAAAGDTSSRATPDPKVKADIKNAPATASSESSSPLRYKLAPPKPSDFEPPRGPIFTYHHDVPALDGSTISFYETSEQ